MKQGDLLINDNLKAEEDRIIDLKKIFPLGKISCKYLKDISYKVDDEWEKLDNLKDFENNTARYIKVKVEKDCSFQLYLGLGYIASPDKGWTDLFNKKGGWTGGDGIFSFNLTNGNDSFSQKENVKTLFVFGDTLIGKIDKLSNRRLHPVLMPNNTIAYLNGSSPKNENIDFMFKKDKDDSVVPYYVPNNESSYEGTLPNHICKYTTNKQLTPWLSGYSPNNVELVFNLYRIYYVDFIDFYNYQLEDQLGYDLELRGIKEFTLFASKDASSWIDLGKHELMKAKDLNDYTRIIIGNEYQYFKIVVIPVQGIGNHYQKDDTDEVVFGLNKVKFYSKGTLISDVSVKATSIMSKNKFSSWFWLQDGVVIDNYLYFLPLLVVPDITKPEGLQFSVKGVSLIKTPIENEKLVFSKHTQKDTSLFVEKNGVQWLFGCAVMANTEQAGAINPDGYIYIYGYTTTYLHRELRVARVRPEEFEYISNWKYFSENGWVSELTEAKSILDNISCEMSVSPITSGSNKGKYLAVFQYNVNSSYIAYSIGDTPTGPFSKPRKVYKCPDQEILGGTSYTYNAKAHPHLSSSDNVLVSYNVNTYEMDHNESNCDVYRPRFIRLKDTSKD